MLFRSQSLLFWHYNLSQPVTKLLAVVFWSAFWILGMIRLRISRKVLTYAVVATGLLACAFGASAWMKAHPVQLAVARQPVAPVHYGMNDDETVRFELYEGDRVVVDSVRNDWARVTTVDGERGWTRRQNLILVGPPYSAPPQTTGENTPEHDKLETQ